MQEMEGTVSGQTRAFKEGLMVKTGKILTLNNCNYTFYQDAKVIVEPGGKLVMNNTVFTACPGVMWKGVEVWGNRNAHQYAVNGINSQGQLIMRNGATIEHADKGVLLAARNSDGTINTSMSGGIIKVENDNNMGTFGGKFTNNKNGIQFWSYHNKYPNGTWESANVSEIDDCQFTNNANYRGGYWTDAMVYMFDVMGVKIRGCDFINQNLNPQGHGINAWGAGFKVEALCNAAIVPCPAQFNTRTSFTNFAKGINLLNSGSYTMYVNNALFNSNSRGVNLQNSNYATIINSTFNIGKAAAIEEVGCEEGTVSSYGIDMLNCYGFAIEENSFAKAAGAPTGTYTGIRVDETKYTYDVIYKNTFTGLSYANYAIGQNWETNRWMGLSYECNSNSNNWADFYVLKRNEEDKESGIQSRQGDTYYAAGNTFSKPNAQWYFFNDGTHEIGYYYSNYHPLQNPDNPLKLYHVTTHGINYSNDCPSHYGSNPGVLSDIQVLSLENQYAEAFADYNNIKVLYDQLKDGGSTQEAVSDIQSALPGDVWALRTSLLGKSPHLSQEVLIEVANRTDILPDDIIFEILAANPDELKNDQLLDYLESKPDPLPGYMIDILRQVSTGTTYKTALQNQMSYKNELKMQAAHDILRHFMNHEEPNLQNIRNWFDNIGGLSADKQIIETYLTEGNYSSALSLADIIPGMYNLSGSDLLDYEDYFSLLSLRISLVQQNRTFAELTIDEIIMVEQIAQKSGSSAQIARSILEFAYNQVYCNCLQVSNSGSMKRGRISSQTLGDALGIRLISEPNPARDYITFNYVLPASCLTAEIEVLNSQGRVIYKIPVTGREGKHTLDTRSLPAGVYLSRICSGNMASANKFLIIR